MYKVGLLHRNFKPQNVLDSEGRAYIADFGLSCASDKKSEEHAARMRAHFYSLKRRTYSMEIENATLVATSLSQWGDLETHRGRVSVARTYSLVHPPGACPS